MNTNLYTQRKINFTGGLSNKIRTEINNTSPTKLAQVLAKDSIVADFDNNKTIAWCCTKVVELLKKIQKLYGISIKFPNNIFVKDLNTLEYNNSDIYGFTNFLPCKITKNTDEITPAVSIIFNKDMPWEKLDEMSDLEFYDAHNTATDYFLEPFIHEFGHIAHENHLIDKLGINKTIQSLIDLTDETTVRKYQIRFSEKATNLCGCAKTSPLELIACDFSKRIIDSINKNTIALNKNPFMNSPYQHFFDIVNLFRMHSLEDLLINKFYNGKIKILDKI